MIENDLQLIYQGKFEVIFPFVYLLGFAKLLPDQRPYISFGQVEFDPGGVSVKTIMTDEIKEISICLYKGIPDLDSSSKRLYFASGLIWVGENGLSLSGDMGDDVHFPWPEGLTDILVELDDEEVKAKQVRNVVIYAEPYTKRVKKKYLSNFISILSGKGEFRP